MVESQIIGVKVGSGIHSEEINCENCFTNGPSIKRQARGDHWAKIVEQRVIKNRVQYIHCR